VSKGLFDFYFNYQGIGNLCKIKDIVGNCINYRWYEPVLETGLYSIKIIVLTLFFVILLKKKKAKPALCMILTYSLLSISFHIGLMPIKQLDELSTWIELANLGGLFAVASILIISVIISLTYKSKKL
jgi:hypothetical protein